MNLSRKRKAGKTKMLEGGSSKTLSSVLKNVEKGYTTVGICHKIMLGKPSEA
jgi:hypothetical protein